MAIAAESVELAAAPPRAPHVYDAWIAMARTRAPLRMAVAHPCDAEALDAALAARQQGLIEPILIGPPARIAAAATRSGHDLAGIEIVPTAHSHASADAAVSLVRAGRATAMMKGSLHSDELLHAVLDKQSGLRTERRLSHAFVLQVPTYPRPLMITDAAVNIYPDLADKRDIVQNAIDLAHALGIALPRVAILSALETVNPEIRSTIDAAALCKMAQRGQIRGALIDGPLAFDNAISPEAARIKGIHSEVAGAADILVVPDLEAGNMLVKQLTFLAAADSAGIVLGARVPIAFASRADNLRNRLASVALCVVLAHARLTSEAAAPP